jgi:hypothetical protein
MFLSLYKEFAYLAVKLGGIMTGEAMGQQYRP